MISLGTYFSDGRRVTLMWIHSDVIEGRNANIAYMLDSGCTISHDGMHCVMRAMS